MLAVAFPPVRKTLRGAAVMATRGVLTATDAVKNSTAMMREELNEMMVEARGPVAGATAEVFGDGRRIIRGIRRRGRRMAVTAAAGALAMREGLHGIVAEARENREDARQQSLAAAESVDLDCHCEPSDAAEAQPHEVARLDETETESESAAPRKRTTSRQRTRSDL